MDCTVAYNELGGYSGFIIQLMDCLVAYIDFEGLFRDGVAGSEMG